MSTPAAMTYSSLVTDVAAYAENDNPEFLAQIPRLIMLAENRIASEVRGLGMLKIVSSTLTYANPILAKPERWRETSSFNVTIDGSRKVLFDRGYEFCRTYWPDPSMLGDPRYYADYGYEHILIVPTPALASAFEFIYFERPEPLSTNNETNWTTRYAPQLLLYATLMEAMPFLKNDERVATWQAFYQQASNSVSVESKRRVMDRSAQIQEG